MNPTCIVIQTSVSNQEDAHHMAKDAVELRLAACVQILGPGLSFYRWHGDTEQASEYYLSFKTVVERRAKLMDWLIEQHPYDVPEIVCQACETSHEYVSWLYEETS